MNRTQKHPKRVVISGWYGERNLGDEAQLAAAIYLIKKLEPDIEITVFSDNPKATSLEHGVKSIQRRGIKSFFKRLKEIYRADLFILGGGTLLFDSGLGGNQIIWLNNVIMSKLIGTPVMYFNGGVGLIYNSMTKYYMRNVCSKIDLITLRDKESENKLRALGIKNDVYIGADSVFTLHSRFNLEHHSNTIGINLRHWTYKEEYMSKKNKKFSEEFGGSHSSFTGFKRTISDVIDQIKKERKIVLFPLSFLKKGGDYDVGVLEDIINITGPQNTEIINKECTYHDLIKRMGSFDFIIGMRLHSLVFAAILNIPMIAISYDPKVDAFMKLIDQDEYIIKMADFKKDVLLKKIEKLMKNKAKIRNKLKNKIPTISEKSAGSAKLMHKLLNNKPTKNQLFREGLVMTFKTSPLIPLLIFYKILRKYKVSMAGLPFYLKILKLINTLSG